MRFSTKFFIFWCNILFIFIHHLTVTKDVASVLGKDLGINVELIVGGRTKLLMRFPKVKEVHLVVATIGALSKLTTTGNNMHLCSFIILPIFLWLFIE